MIKVLLLVGLMLPRANAIVSPTDILGVANTLGDLFGTASDVSAAVELAQELELTTDAESVRDPTADKITKVTALAQELGYETDSINEWTKTLREDNPSADKIRTITKMVRSAKRMRKMFSSLTTQAKQAEVEQASIARQQLAVSAELLGEIQSQQLNLKMNDLTLEKENRLRIRKLAQSLQHKGMKLFKSGAMQFPSTKASYERAIAVAEKFRPGILAIMLIILFARGVFHQVSFSSAYQQFDVLRDGIVAITLLFSFPQIVRAVLFVADTFNGANLAEHVYTPAELWNYSASGATDWLAAKIALPGAYLSAAISSLVSIALEVCIGFTILFVPVAILLSQVMNFSRLWGLWIGTMFVIAIWPALWNGLGLLSAYAIDNGRGENSILFGLGMSLLQLASPLAVLRLLQVKAPGMGEASAALRSTGRLVGEAAQAIGGVAGTLGGAGAVAISATSGGTYGMPESLGQSQLFSYGLDQIPTELGGARFREGGDIMPASVLSASSSRQSTGRSSFAEWDHIPIELGGALDTRESDGIAAHPTSMSYPGNIHRGERAETNIKSESTAYVRPLGPVGSTEEDAT